MMFSERRFAIAIVFAFAVTATACQKQPGSSAPTSTSSKSKTDSNVSAELDATAETIVAILNDVEAGKSKPEQFTDAFKKAVAEPVTDDDRKLGYSSREWDRYIQSLKGLRVNYQPEETRKLIRNGHFAWDGVDSDATPQRSHFVCCVGSGEHAQVDWLQVQSRHGIITATEFEANFLHGLAFLNALIERTDKLAIAQMTPELRSALAPVFSKADEGRGYNIGTLMSKLSDFRGDASGFKITAIENGIMKGNFITPRGNRFFSITLGEYQTKKQRYIQSFHAD